MGLWDLFRKSDDKIIEWDQNFTRRVSTVLGIKPNDQLTPSQRIQRSQRLGQFSERPPMVAQAEDFISEADAEMALRRSNRLPPSANFLCIRGILQQCWLPSGQRGVTRSSVEAELVWRQTASRWRKCRRAIGGVVRWF